MKTLLKYTNSEYGFSLVEVLIGVGLLSMTAIYVAQVTTDITNTSSNASANIQIATFVQKLQNRLLIKNVCNLNFQGYKFSTGTVSQLLDANGKTLAAVDEEVDNSFKVSSMTLTKQSSTRADLSVNFEKLNAKTLGLKFTTRKFKISIFLENDNDTIKSCLFSVDEVVGDIMPFICNGEGTILDDNGTAEDTSDDLCVHAGYSIEQCPDGEYVRKFDLVNIDDGSGNLQPFFRPDCIEISKPKNLNCPQGEILQGYDPEDGIVCRQLIASDINEHFQGSYSDCSSTSTFPIRASGDAVNITCGTPLPTATSTPTPTVTPTPNGPRNIACTTISANTFHTALRLSNSLNPLIVGNKIDISVTGVTRGGSLLGFKCKYYTDGISTQFSVTDLQDRAWPGSPHPGLSSWSDESYTYVSIKRTDALGTGNYTFSCGASLTVPNFVNNEIMCVDSMSAGTKCNIFSESMGQALTGIEDITSLEICADSTGSSQVMFADENDFLQF